VSDWYWSTFLSRRQNDQAKQIIIMQRWREDDLIGEILEREGEKWEVLKIPAIDAN
jgi:terminase large subunit